LLSRLVQVCVLLDRALQRDCAPGQPQPQADRRGQLPRQVASPPVAPAAPDCCARDRGLCG
jgi:hypothetical protein